MRVGLKTVDGTSASNENRLYGEYVATVLVMRIDCMESRWYLLVALLLARVIDFMEIRWYWLTAPVLARRIDCMKSKWYWLVALLLTV